MEEIENVNNNKNLGFTENELFNKIAFIIENHKLKANIKVNEEFNLMAWEIGKFLKENKLDNKRAEYGNQIVVTVSRQLVEQYGKSFDRANLYRMVQFFEKIKNSDIVVTLSQQLSWSHILALLPVSSEEAIRYYIDDTITRGLNVRQLRDEIKRKSFERKEIANSQIITTDKFPLNAFKDPFLLDVLGLKDNFLEADLEKAILVELEKFILEFGHGITFVERQKRMNLGSDDFVLDLLFFHRILKRLIAIELKIGKFKPAYKGQMEFYLRWLSKFERTEGENEPIGIILCTESNEAEIELMELDKVGIAVAEYWTKLPPKEEFESKICEMYEEAKEKIERNKLLPKKGKKIEYFFEDNKSEED